MSSFQTHPSVDQAMEDVQIAKTLKRIKHKILVFSGKGGVGKSTTAANLAMTLALSGQQVGLLDIDFHGPSIPKLMGMAGRRPDMDGEMIKPIPFVENLKVMSLGLLLSGGDDAVVWRGPLKNSAIKQLIKDVAWGDLDYLIVDSPPGTGDEPLSLVQIMKDLTGAIIVTQPQQLSVDDVRRSVSFCEKMNLPVLGIVENMSGFICPNCGERVEIFKSGGGEELAKQKNIPFLGKVPIDPSIVESSDAGKPFVYYNSDSPAAKVFEEMAGRLMRQLEANESKTDDDAETEEKHNGAIQRFAMPLANGMVSAHFGHAEKFIFIDYDVDNNVAVKTEEKTPPPHEHGVIPNWIAEEKTDVLLTGGIGPAAQQLLEQKGVKVVAGAPHGKPLYVVSKYVKGELEESDNTCDH